MFNSIKCKYWTYISYSVLYICAKLLTYCRLYIRKNFWNTIEKKSRQRGNPNHFKIPKPDLFLLGQYVTVTGVWVFVHLLLGNSFPSFHAVQNMLYLNLQENNKSLSFFQNTLLWSECFEKVLRFNTSETKLFCHQHKSILSIASILVDPSKT